MSISTSIYDYDILCHDKLIEHVYWGWGCVWLLGLFFSPFRSDKITYVLKKLIGKRLIFVGGDCFVCSSCFYQKGKLTVNHRYLRILIFMLFNVLK